LVIGGYSIAVSGVPESDHFYRSVARDSTVPPPTAARILSHYKGRPVILVAASGGGILAEAWPARVLSGVEQAMEQQQSSLAGRLALISSVSGGSAGAMLFLESYTREGGLPRLGPGDADLDGSLPVVHAERASLDDVTWGLVYPDLVWSLFPLLK